MTICDGYKPKPHADSSKGSPAGARLAAENPHCTEVETVDFKPPAPPDGYTGDADIPLDFKPAAKGGDIRPHNLLQTCAVEGLRKSVNVQ